MTLAEGGKQSHQVSIGTTSGVSAGNIVSWRWTGNPNSAIAFDAEL